MPDTTTQRRAFDFLLDHFRTQEPFTKNEFHDAVPEWSKSSLDTYWSKQIKRLLSRADRNQFRVTEAFRPYANWDSFRKHIATQVRRIFSDYTSLIYDDLIIYEFFMPLTNEGPLRTALDALFYKETILARLRTIGHEKVMERFPIQADESLEAYLDRICRWIAAEKVPGPICLRGQFGDSIRNSMSGLVERRKGCRGRNGLERSGSARLSHTKSTTLLPENPRLGFFLPAEGRARKICT